MNRTNRVSPFLLALVLSLIGAPSFGATQVTAAATRADSRVHVEYVNPQSFSENRFNGPEDRYNDFHYLEPLKEYIVKRATPLLGAGQSLYITITDISLAGSYQPWLAPRMRHVRIMNDQYPPRIDLSFKWVDRDGKVLREGSRKLRGLGYLSSGLTSPGDTDPLRYDKALLRRWLGRGLDRL